MMQEDSCKSKERRDQERERGRERELEKEWLFVGGNEGSLSQGRRRGTRVRTVTGVFY